MFSLCTVSGFQRLIEEDITCFAKKARFCSTNGSDYRIPRYACRRFLCRYGHLM